MTLKNGLEYVLSMNVLHSDSLVPVQSVYLSATFMSRESVTEASTTKLSTKIFEER